MFGYVKPYKAELKVRKWEHYRPVYCGLCHALRQKFGVMHRFALSYDITFLALVLDAFGDKNCEYTKKRCIASPFKKKCVVCNSKAVNFTADVSVILSYFKICDSIADSNAVRAIGYKFLRLLFLPAYKKAKKTLPWFDAIVIEKLNELSQIERKMEKNIDAPADAFAKILASLSRYFDGNNARITYEIFYHIGRAIYIIDALCDVNDDVKKKNYNPVVLCNLERDEVIETINCSLNTAIAALNLVNADTNLILNILALGIPDVLDKKEKTNE